MVLFASPNNTLKSVKKTCSIREQDPDFLNLLDKYLKLSMCFNMLKRNLQQGSFPELMIHNQNVDKEIC